MIQILEIFSAWGGGHGENTGKGALVLSTISDVTTKVKAQGPARGRGENSGADGKKKGRL